MKKTLLIICSILSLFCMHNIAFAQAGGVYTVAGGGTTTLDGVSATAAYMHSSTGVCVDPAGNIYVGDDSLNTIRKIDLGTGLITTIATVSPTGPWKICSDAHGNIFFPDAYLGAGTSVVRKIDAITGSVTTVAGGGTLTTDGVPATAHTLDPQGVYVDMEGNIYAGGSNRIYKVDGTTGIITTILGTGISDDGGDGGPASAATITGTANNISMDAAGNLYFGSQFSPRIRKIDATTGIVTTVAGGGTSTADGILATNAQFGTTYSCVSDGVGNLFIADRGRGLIRRVNASTGIINTIAGVEGGGSTVEGAPALTAQVNPFFMWIDPASNTVYYSTRDEKVKKFSYMTLYPGTPLVTTDSFTTSFYQRCNGPRLTMIVPHYIAGRSLKTVFGDGTSDSSSIVPGFISGGYAIVDHSYATPGTYTIKQFLYNGISIEDSVTMTYIYVFCRTLPVRFFKDDNLNCSKDTSEPFYSHYSLTEVDSNGIAVDTISATSGFSYNAYAQPGDIYKFTFISAPGTIAATCPATGYISDTLLSTMSSYPVKYFGLSCGGGSFIDLSVNAAVAATGVRDQVGGIYVRNLGCSATNGSVTLHFSPKYVFDLAYIHPAPTSASGNTITWDFINLSADAAAPRYFHYALFNNPATGYLTPGDTVHSQVIVTPLAGDIDPTNNAVIFVDTVRASCDPNFIAVTPPGCINSGLLPSQLQYTVHFENTGTDTADNIYVMDTLPGFVNAASLRIVMASHVMNIDIQSYDGRKVVRFDFPNIKLLDSSHHGECDGVVMYTINTNAGLPDGVDIMNRVGIYFDYNSVVMTNEVHNKIGGCWPVGVPGSSSTMSANLYPNPVTGTLYVDLAGPADYSITNIIGSALQQGSFSAGTNTLDLKGLPTGVYIISLTDNNGAKSVHKIIRN